MMINEAHAQATAASGRGDGQYPSGLHDGAEISTAAGGQTKAEVPLTMEAVITRENLMLAYQRVVENKGVAELKPWLKKNWRSVWQVWALLRRQAELDGMPAINAKRIYRIMRQNALLLERKPAVPPSKRAHTGRVAVKESNQRWCSDGFEFRCDNGEKLRVTFALDCCDREALHWAVTTGGFNSETVQDVMLGAVERRFGNELPASPVEWLTDNGSCYRANETRQFARMLGLEPKNTAVRSPESNGIAESFVKTIKRDYISVMPKPDGLTAAKNLAEAFEHYNEWHPHSALGYRSPREYLRQQASNGLSDNRCLEI